MRIAENHGFVDLPSEQQMQRAAKDEIEVEWPNGDWKPVVVAPIGGNAAPGAGAGAGAGGRGGAAGGGAAKAPAPVSWASAAAPRNTQPPPAATGSTSRHRVSVSGLPAGTTQEGLLAVFRGFNAVSGAWTAY